MDPLKQNTKTTEEWISATWKFISNVQIHVNVSFSYINTCHTAETDEIRKGTKVLLGNTFEGLRTETENWTEDWGLRTTLEGNTEMRFKENADDIS
jgi:hypothetical protein